MSADDPFAGSPEPEKPTRRRVKTRSGTSVPDTDGRTLRKTQNRQKLLDAGMALIAKRQWRLSVVLLAKTSGMSDRTFFYHFPTLDDYLEALIAVHGTTLRADLTKQAAEFNDTLLRIVLKGSPK